MVLQQLSIEGIGISLTAWLLDFKRRMPAGGSRPIAANARIFSKEYRTRNRFAGSAMRFRG